VFTARYGLGPYITQIRFVFKRLNELITRILHNAESCKHSTRWLETLFVFLFFHYFPLERSLIRYVTVSRSFGGHLKPNSEVTQIVMYWKQNACRQIKERVH